jgi:hypothetical protein
MSEATGQPAPTQTTGGGSTFLTEGGGNPQGAETQTPANTTPAANGSPPATARPEYIPEKFWNAEKNEADYEALGKSYSNLNTLLGGEKAPVVKDWDNKEAVDRWYRAGGRPDSADAYEFDKPDAAPEGFYDDDAEKSARQWFHENGLNPRQAKNLHAAFVKTQLERHQAWNTQQEQAKKNVADALVREHGPQYEGFAKGAQAAIQKFADPDFYKHLDETGLGNDPRMVRVFGRIAKAMMGENALKGAPSSQATLNADQLTAEIASFRQKNWKALTNPDDPTNKALSDKLEQMHRQLIDAKGAAPSPY